MAGQEFEHIELLFDNGKQTYENFELYAGRDSSIALNNDALLLDKQAFIEKRTQEQKLREQIIAEKVAERETELREKIEAEVRAEYETKLRESMEAQEVLGIDGTRQEEDITKEGRGEQENQRVRPLREKAEGEKGKLIRWIEEGGKKCKSNKERERKNKTVVGIAATLTSVELLLSILSTLLPSLVLSIINSIFTYSIMAFLFFAVLREVKKPIKDGSPESKPKTETEVGIAVVLIYLVLFFTIYHAISSLSVLSVLASIFTVGFIVFAAVIVYIEYRKWPEDWRRSKKQVLKTVIGLVVALVVGGVIFSILYQFVHSPVVSIINRIYTYSLTAAAFAVFFTKFK